MGSTVCGPLLYFNIELYLCPHTDDPCPKSNPSLKFLDCCFPPTPTELFTLTNAPFPHVWCPLPALSYGIFLVFIFEENQTKPSIVLVGFHLSLTLSF